MSSAITRKEMLLQSISDGVSSAIAPITREEQYLAYIAGEGASYPKSPITREEGYLAKIAQNGTGGGTTEIWDGTGISINPIT